MEYIVESGRVGPGEEMMMPIQNTTVRLLGGTLLAAVLMSGCYVTTSARVRPIHPVATVQVSAPPPPTATVQVEVQQPQLAAGVTVIQTSCQQGAAEACNGLDDNCNGQIDEGCGYSSGNIQVTLAWATGADMDLYVTDPQGETLSYSHTTTNSGGQLDHDARGQCNQNQANNTIENVFWNTPNPPPGNYQVQVHYWGECNSHAGPTQVTLSIAVGGRVIGAYNYVLAPQQRADVANFTI